ncbi:MAG: S46 family peptidase [Hymenobacteraceae bacterium]|nr:S46 family peptidase [Hymenobacteraceae bacterium]
MLPTSCFRRALLLALLPLLSLLPARADEGMWLPLLLKQLNESDMKARGMRMSADDIYSVNHSSLKDAVVQFGGGCTGEIISGEGLLLTNHHCGFSQIQQHSSVEKDYLTNGYWAKTRADELPNPGLTAMFIIRMEDVTQQVISGMPANVNETGRENYVQQQIERLTKEATAGTHYGALIRPFFYGQEYYMFVTETFPDVRLVGAPPSGIGKFGGDTDNWMWPRHTGDFSLFRIYAGADGKPASYAAANVPLKPRHFLPISLAPVKEGDFTLVFGFPGRTTEYLTSWGVREVQDISDPARVALRDARLKRWDVAMKSSDRLRIAYAAKQASLANYWKKWLGEMRGLRRLNAVLRKQEQETRFRQWVSADPARQTEYGTVLSGIEQSYRTQQDLTLARDYVTEATLGIELFALANNTFQSLADLLTAKTPPDATARKAAVEKIRAGLPNWYKNYDAATDQLIAGDVLRMQAQAVPATVLAPAVREAAGSNNDYTSFAQRVFLTSRLVSLEKANQLLDQVAAGDNAVLLADPAFQFTSAVVSHFKTTILAPYQRSAESITLLSRTYVRGLRAMQTNQKFYPDANSTLRVAYGNVRGYEPADGTRYEYLTTIDGILEKADSTKEEFTAPRALLSAWKRKDYGAYAVSGTVPVAFLASNHTTGGNSGSPVINGRGELMGLNFDRVWEGTMSDIQFDPAMGRNIAMAMHYLLFVIDKVGNSPQLIQEMKIVREPHPNLADAGAHEGKKKEKKEKRRKDKAA